MALRRVVLLVRDVDASLAWWAQLGLRATVLEPGVYARLEAADEGSASSSAGSSIPIDLQRVDREAELVTGYAPMLHVEVPSGLDALVPGLLMSGGRLDGAIQHSEVAQVAVLRSPDGHFVSVSERNEAAYGDQGQGQQLR